VQVELPELSPATGDDVPFVSTTAISPSGRLVSVSPWTLGRLFVKSRTNSPAAPPPPDNTVKTLLAALSILTATASDDALSLGPVRQLVVREPGTGCVAPESGYQSSIRIEVSAEDSKNGECPIPRSILFGSLMEPPID
jgi:hypothetical protein